MSQLQHVEEDSLTSGDTPADMSQLQHVEEDSLASGDTPADMSQLHVEEDSLASGDTPADMSQLQQLAEGPRVEFASVLFSLQKLWFMATVL